MGGAHPRVMNRAKGQPNQTPKSLCLRAQRACDHDTKFKTQRGDLGLTLLILALGVPVIWFAMYALLVSL
jgi:hypothetical protein